MTVGLPETLLIIGTASLLDYVMPALTRRDLFFGVTVSPSFRMSGEGKAIRRRYRVQIVICTAAALALALAGFRSAAIIVEGAASLIAYLLARRAALPHATAPSTQHEATLEPRRMTLPGGAIIQTGPFVLLVSVAVYLAIRWNDIPPQFPIHWGADQRPDSWSDRTVLGVYMPLLIALITCVFNAMVSVTITRTRKIDVRGPRAIAETRFRNGVMSILTMVGYVIAIVCGVIALLPIRRDVNAMPHIDVIFETLLALAAAFIAVVVFMGQGGSRLVAALPADQPTGDRTPDEHWLLGLIYFNRNDPAWQVEKRFGLGFTLNFSHPVAWLFLTLIVAFVIVMIFLPKFI